MAAGAASRASLEDSRDSAPSTSRLCARLLAGSSGPKGTIGMGAPSSLANDEKRPKPGQAITWCLSAPKIAFPQLPLMALSH